MTLPGLEGWGGEALSEGDNRYRARIASCSGMASELWGVCMCAHVCVQGKGRREGLGDEANSSVGSPSHGSFSPCDDDS